MSDRPDLGTWRRHRREEAFFLFAAIVTRFDLLSISAPPPGVIWNKAAKVINGLKTSTDGFAACKFMTSGVNDNIAFWTASNALGCDTDSVTKPVG